MVNKPKISIMYSLLVMLLLAAFFYPSKTLAAPYLANYYLGQLPTDDPTVAKLAANQVLILSPEQGAVSLSIIKKIKQLNSQIILLAYVPSKSYNQNWKNYPFNTVYGDFKVNDDWWLKDGAGKITSDWPGQLSANLSAGWSDYLVNYINTHILSQNVWDGVFLDVVYDGISWFNNGDLDLNNDGKRDDPRNLDAEWESRTKYLLDQARLFPIRYIVINGSSKDTLQKNINGRMFENFPTPWEARGQWGGLMTNLEYNQKLNRQPQLYIFNANTNNTGNQADYKKVRFGLSSSLMLNNVYFSFDYGTENHNQTWWYDEYDVKLGNAISEANSQDNQPRFSEDVWRREFANGVAVVNASYVDQQVDLGGEYEKILGKQDPGVNDGTISDSVWLDAQDGIILYKTLRIVNNVPFNNGSFVRFFGVSGQKERNGFFAFEDSAPGGAKIYLGDLTGDDTAEKIVVTGPKMEIFNNSGSRWFNGYPFGANYKGQINFAVGKLLGNGQNQIVVTSARNGGEVLVYSYNGDLLKNKLFPLGKKYLFGFSPVIVSLPGKTQNVIYLATGPKVNSEVLAFDYKTNKIVKRFYPFNKNFKGGVNISAGDINNDGQAELVAISGYEKKPVVRVFNLSGKLLKQFTVGSFFGSKIMEVGVTNINLQTSNSIAVISSN